MSTPTPLAPSNLHRELAPITAPAWAQIEDEARRTFQRNVGGRRAVDVTGPDGPELAAVGTGHLTGIEAPAHGVTARLRQARPLVELRAPFRVTRDAVDDVERGAQDSDWQPVKDAVRTMAFAEDRIVFEGYPAAGVDGLRERTSHPVVALPEQPREYPDAVSRALTTLRLAGVDGPYALLLGADAYTAVSETSDHGYPVAAHLGRLLDAPPVWAPALDGAFLLSTRGGDFELRLGEDLAIGYTAHDASGIELYFRQTLTFLVYTDEAVVALR
ncbi:MULTISPECIES: family 1 encapsulin nanocompartment shell protein [Streptomyces]|uniref:family 1 encapsulin nanocompartment shell protein n=1 Tax=Streptomyces TaxID=1883 RepID=UPI0002F5A6F3|nr:MULTISPECIES: family 1 encapsulin nanocompartment shell protein [Streptomyces]MBY8866947.1 bacteriocin family protein [Streptomyces sennicomposti]MYX46974.1 bacteriocin [Streptomyces sp. SID89]NED35257.1 bacteriocin family protein [Streptomyces sp. SID8499]